MSLSKESDEALLVRLKDDSESAFQELFGRYFVRLTHFSYSIVRTRDLAEEATLNVFHNVWRRRSTFAPKGPLKNYLFAAVGNQALTLRGSHFRNRNTSIDQVPDSELVDDVHPKGSLQYKELHREVDELITRLPPQRQLIFRLNRLEGLSYAEIAEALELSPHTVQNQMVQAIRQLAPHLDPLLKSLKRARS